MDIQQLIKERYSELPPDIQSAIKSNDLASKFDKIVAKHNLHVDQNGALQTETLLVMLGLEPSTDYVDNLQKELDVSRSEAQSIAEDVNNDILNSIKNSLRILQETREESEGDVAAPAPIPKPPAQAPDPRKNVIPPNLPITPQSSNIPKPPVSNLSPLEKVGGFTLEKNPSSNSPLYNDSTLKKESVLNDLENIEKLKPKNASAFVDHLLANPVSNPQQVEIKKPSTPPATPKPGVDPYREPF